MRTHPWWSAISQPLLIFDTGKENVCRMTLLENIRIYLCRIVLQSFFFFLILGWHGFLALSNSRKEISAEGMLRSIFGRFFFLNFCTFKNCTTCQIIDWLIEWWSDLPADWLIDWLIDWCNDRLTGCLTDHGLADWLNEWLIDRLIDWYTDCLTNWLTGWLIDWLAYSTTGWLTNQLAAGWLVDWQLDTDRIISWLTNGLNERLVSSVTGD